MSMPLWFSNLVFWSVQVALLALAAGLLRRALKILQPGVLLAYWRSLLAISLLLPFVEPWHRTQALATPTVSPDFITVPPASSFAPAAGHWYLPNIQTVALILGIVILVGIASRFTILAFGLLKLRRLRQTSYPIASSAESAAVLQSVRILVADSAEFRLSAQVDSPVTFGFAAPVVLLPDRFASLEPRFQSAIACHELLHVRRQDWAHHLGEEVVHALFWFHPAIAWRISRTRLAREQVVDLEVVRLTSARKTYLETLLEFTNGRASFAAIPAPPFLAENQLVERVSLMSKEVHMSRKKLIFSVGLISCCLALVIAVSAWTFPLKAQAVARNTGGSVAGGISKGIVGGASAGRSSGVNASDPQREPSVDTSTVWTDTVKRGAMPLHVRGAGTLVRGEGSANLVAQVTVPASMASGLKSGQNASVASKNVGLGKGHVISIGSVSGDSRTVEIALDAVPQGAAAGREVDAIIEIGTLDNVLYVGRPVNGEENSEITLFKIVNNGSEAVRTDVKLGRASMNTIEVLNGLNEGDKIILSDTSRVRDAERVRLTDDKRPSSH